MSFKLHVEMSGLCLVHVGKNATNAYLVADTDHTPRMFVPTYCIVNADAIGTEPQRKAFGLDTIAVPGGMYLTEVLLDGASVEVGAETKKSSYIMTPDKAAARASAEPTEVEWKSLAFSIDQSEIDPRSPDLTKANASVRLPGGPLVTGRPNTIKERTARWDIVPSAGASWNQVLGDRLVMTCDIETINIAIDANKDGVLLSLDVAPQPRDSSVSISLISHCGVRPGRGGRIEDLSGFDALYSSASGATGNARDALITDGRPICPSRYMLEP